MSIVERALDKVRGTVPAGADKALPAPAVNGAIASGPASAPRREKTPSLFAPRHRIAVDLGRLREERILATGTAAEQLADELRRIKWPILNAAFDRTAGQVSNGHLLLVTSALAGEGKTFVSINLALNIARAGDCSVILVDGDSPRRRATELLSLEGHAGLSDVLAAGGPNVADVIVGTDISGLMVLPAGRPGVHMPELLAGNRMDDLLDWFKSHCGDSIVIFDSPPLLAATDSLVLSRRVGHVLVVVRAEHTAQSVMREALGLLDEGTKVSCTLNRTAARRDGSYYGSSYLGLRRDHGG